MIDRSVTLAQFETCAFSYSVGQIILSESNGPLDWDALRTVSANSSRKGATCAVGILCGYSRSRKRLQPAGRIQFIYGLWRLFEMTTTSTD